MTLEKYPFVSIIVCAFNEEKWLKSCLASLAAQTYPSTQYEILVIDDESSDSTFSDAEEFIYQLADYAPQTRLIRIQHGGLSIARNAGIRLSQGEIIAFIDGDAVAESSWIEELVRPFSNGADYVGGRINLLNKDSWVARFLQRTRHRQYFGPHIFNDQCIGCNMAYRKEIFDDVGGFYENFVSRGDESTLQDRLRGRFQYAAAPDAIVLHERPDTIMSALRVTWSSATLNHLCAKATAKIMYWKDMLMAIEQFLMLLFIILLGLVWIQSLLLILPLIISALALIRRLYLRPLNRAILKGLVEDYGMVRGVVGHFLFCLCHNAISLTGRIVSPWIHRDVEIVAPMTTELTILKSVESRYRKIS